MADYTLLQAQADVAGLRGQIAHLLATAELINLLVDGTALFQNPVYAAPGGTAETWHDMRPLSNSFVGTISGEYPPQYRLGADGWVEIHGTIQLPGAGSYNSITFFTLPSGYRPGSHPVSWPVSQLGGAPSTDANTGFPRMFIDTTGVCQVAGISSSINGTNIRITGKFPLDSTGVITS